MSSCTASWYSTYLNQFTQPDTVVPDPYNPQDWNHYAYARNNPIRYNDPSGHCAVDGDDWCHHDNGNAGGNGGGIISLLPVGPASTVNPHFTSNYKDGLIGPPAPIYDLSNLRDVPLSTTLHPSNVILGDKHTSAGVVPVYLNGEVVGYKVARYSPDASTIRINMEVFSPINLIRRGFDKLITDNVMYLAETYGSKTLLTLAKKASWISTAYDVVSTANEMVVLDGNITFGELNQYPPLRYLPDYNDIFSLPFP